MEPGEQGDGDGDGDGEYVDTKASHHESCEGYVCTVLARNAIQQPSSPTVEASSDRPTIPQPAEKSAQY